MASYVGQVRKALVWHTYDPVLDEAHSHNAESADLVMDEAKEILVIFAGLKQVDHGLHATK